MILDKLFMLMAEKKASDIFISAGAPINIKIQGNCIPINQQVMDPATIQRMAYELLKPEQVTHLETARELNLSVGIADIGNFRINMFWQRNSIGIVVRFITSAIPRIEELALPAVLSDIIMGKRGLVLVVGATGSGKSTTIASMIRWQSPRWATDSCWIALMTFTRSFAMRHFSSVGSLPPAQSFGVKIGADSASNCCASWIATGCNAPPGG